MTIREEIGSEVVDAAQEVEEQMKVEPIRSEERPEFETEGGGKAVHCGRESGQRGYCAGEEEVKGGDFIKKKPEEINQKGTLYGELP
jgi:hypothetical protein